jgi:hypothetical protein
MLPRWSPAGLVVLVLTATVAVAASFGGGTRDVQAQIGANPCSKVAVKPTMPPTFDLQGSLDFQLSADCVAWQEFIYLNWRARGRGIPDPQASPSAFGLPVSKTGAYTTVWESYANPDDVFSTATARKNLTAGVARSNGLRTLSAISKSDGDDVHLSGFQQAVTLGWLTSRYRDVTFYEEHIGNDELAYIISNRLTSIARQSYCVTHGGLSLPAGTNTDVDCDGKVTNYGDHGAIEIKAAWLQLHDPAQYSRYLISRANLVYPDGRIVNDAVVGLVGLHIVRKVPKAAQFSWATFEHVDNDPDATPYPSSPATMSPSAVPTATPAWTYYRSNCTGPCQVNALATPCANGRTAPPPGCQAYTVPTQTQRITPVGAFAEQTTGTFRAALARAGANGSVFRYYRMIDTQWPRANTPTRQKPFARIPLSQGSPDPSWPVANTTMETYVQFAACMDCHMQAKIATPKVNAAAGRAQITLFSPKALSAMKLKAGAAPYASDWSFVFSKAHQP